MSGWKDHWQLKLLALVMAVLVWLFVHLKQTEPLPRGAGANVPPVAGEPRP